MNILGFFSFFLHFSFFTVLISMHLFSSPLLFFEDLTFKNVEEGGALYDWKGQFVEVRGFWYPLTDETGVLASHPLLKSCCLQIPSKVEEQLFVKGSHLNLLPSQRALTLEGFFNVEPIYNAKGELIQFFVLDNAKEVSRKTESVSLSIIGGGVVLALFIGVLIHHLRYSRLN